MMSKFNAPRPLPNRSTAMLNPDCWRKNASPISWKSWATVPRLGPVIQAYAETVDQARSRVKVKRVAAFASGWGTR